MSEGGDTHFRLGALLGSMVLLALAIFLVTGGNLGGKQKVAGDADLPQVSSPASSRADGTARADVR